MQGQFYVMQCLLKGSLFDVELETNVLSCDRRGMGDWNVDVGITYFFKSAPILKISTVISISCFQIFRFKFSEFRFHAFLRISKI